MAERALTDHNGPQKHLPVMDAHGVGFCSEKCPYFLAENQEQRFNQCCHPMNADRSLGKYTSVLTICYPWARECAEEKER